METAQGKGKGKKEKNRSPRSFLPHGPAKGGKKVVGTKRTRAKVNARSPIVEQNYQRMKEILRDEFNLRCTQVRHHFFTCLIPCNTILPISEFQGEDPIYRSSRVEGQAHPWSMHGGTFHFCVCRPC